MRSDQNLKEISKYKYGNIVNTICFLAALSAILLLGAFMSINITNVILAIIISALAGYFYSDISLAIIKKISHKY